MYDGAFPSFLLIILFFLVISLILFWILGNKVLMIFFFFSHIFYTRNSLACVVHTYTLHWGSGFSMLCWTWSVHRTYLLTPALDNFGLGLLQITLDTRAHGTLLGNHQTSITVLRLRCLPPPCVLKFYARPSAFFWP